MAQDIKQTVTFNARPGVVFEMLMDSRKHESFTGAPAEISREPGGAFSCYGGHLTGVTLETVKNKLIVQAWRAKSWPKGAWSIATFNLAGASGGKTKLGFTHTGVPRSAVKDITQGWKSHYWGAMKAYLKAAK
jgi:activator of HSP90 ATPase